VFYVVFFGEIESKARVIRWMPQYEDERTAFFVEQGQTLSDQLRPNAFALKVRRHGHGTQAHTGK
jgi:hypothetical protein